MGKQIEVFMSSIDITKLMEYVISQSDSILDSQGKHLTIEECSSGDILSIFLVGRQDKLVKNDSGYIDAIVSEVIQFSKGNIGDNKYIYPSRLWAEFKYFDNRHVYITKSKEFSNLYIKYAKWIKKNSSKSKCENYYICNNALKSISEEGYVMKSGPNEIISLT